MNESPDLSRNEKIKKYTKEIFLLFVKKILIFDLNFNRLSRPVIFIMG